jgi:hypothetical protein
MPPYIISRFAGQFIQISEYRLSGSRASKKKQKHHVSAQQWECGINENGLTESGVRSMSSPARHAKQHTLRHRGGSSSLGGRPTPSPRAAQRRRAQPWLRYVDRLGKGEGTLPVPAMTAACFPEQSWFAAAVDDSEGEQSRRRGREWPMAHP